MIFSSNRGAFNKKNEAFKDMFQGHMAMDIESYIKISSGIPVKTGALRADIRHYKTNNDHWRVEAGKSYAAVQEVGQRMTGKGAPTAKFKHYSTPGTGAGWFLRSIDAILRNREQYISEAKKALDL